jgi:hypothetical protein
MSKTPDPYSGKRHLVKGKTAERSLGSLDSYEDFRSRIEASKKAVQLQQQGKLVMSESPRTAKPAWSRPLSLDRLRRKAK